MKISLNVKSDPSESFKDELNKLVGKILKEVLKDECEDMMIEYVAIMALNNNTLIDIAENLKDLMDKKQADEVCDKLKVYFERFNVHNSFEKVEAKPSRKRERDEDSKVSQDEPKAKERITESFSTKELRKSRKKRLEKAVSKLPSHYDLSLINAYKLYLVSKFPKSFLEYQLYLKGEYVLNERERFSSGNFNRSRGRGNSRGFRGHSRGRCRGRGRGGSNSFIRTKEISGLEKNEQTEEAPASLESFSEKKNEFRTKSSQ